MALVQLQRWWRRCLLKLYESKCATLADQQHMLETKIAILKAQLVDPTATLPSTSLYGGLEMLHEEPADDIALWLSEHEKIRAAVFDQLQAIKTNVQYATPSPAVTPARPSRPIKGLGHPAPSPRTSCPPSPAHSASSHTNDVVSCLTPRSDRLKPHRKSTRDGPSALQTSLEGMEKSFHVLLRVMRVVFAGRQTEAKAPSSVIVSRQIQQTIVRLLSDIHERLDDTMQLSAQAAAAPKPTWTTVAVDEPVLPYSMGSQPWNRLLHDWAHGNENKVAALERWLDGALHRPTEHMKPIELQCLHPVVRDGFLKLVVPTLKLKHANLVVQTKPLTGSVLRLQFQAPPSPERSSVYNMQGTMVA